MKKIIAIIVAVAVLLTVVFAGAVFADDNDSGYYCGPRYCLQGQDDQTPYQGAPGSFNRFSCHDWD